MQQELEKAENEKERVYVAGIGWQYQSNKTRVKEARQSLQDYKDKQQISDLKYAQEKETKLLQDIIDEWNDVKNLVSTGKQTAQATKEAVVLLGPDGTI